MKIIVALFLSTFILFNLVGLSLIHISYFEPSLVKNPSPIEVDEIAQQYDSEDQYDDVPFEENMPNPQENLVSRPVRPRKQSSPAKAAAQLEIGELPAEFSDDIADKDVYKRQYMVCSGKGSHSTFQDGHYGSYQTAGDLYIFQNGMKSTTNYRRELDLINGVASCEFGACRREYFVSESCNTIICRITGDIQGISCLLYTSRCV